METFILKDIFNNKKKSFINSINNIFVDLQKKSIFIGNLS